MKVSYSWLKDYVEVNIDPNKFAEILTMAGSNVASWEKRAGDYIFDFEITTNRPDCLSMIGIAREAAALLKKKLKVPKELAEGKTGKPKEKAALSVKLEDTELCPYYTARIIRDVEVKPSPDWLRSRIISAGLRPVNNIVDITNFVLLETGQPLHAFDLDRIDGNLCVRRAEKDEKIITIDNTPRVCDEEVLIIADETKPLAIAGVMGGLATEVTDMTRNILLESAFFNPISVRRTSRALGVSSESSYRFERRIDGEMVARASNRASALIEEIAGGKIGPMTDAGRKKPYTKTITFNLKKANSLLGVSIEKKNALKILKSLGFLAQDRKGKVKVTPPSFRGDIKSEVDLAEEIARIYGYENIPLTIPRIVGNTKIKEFTDILEEGICQILTRLGMNEIMTYSLVSRRSIKEFGIPQEGVISIQNPLSIDQEVMRPTMLIGMLGAISHNLKRKVKGLMFFELGKLYVEKNTSLAEEPVLSLGLAGARKQDWKSREENFDLYDLKGIIERLFEELGLRKEALFKAEGVPGLDENTSSVIEYDGEVVAHLGEVDKNICRKFDIEKNAFYAEISLEKIKKKVNLERKYAPYSRYPAVLRDVSVVLDKSVTSREFVTIIKQMGKELVRDISLIGVYTGEQIPEGKKGLLYRIEYRSDKKTLEDSEVEKLHSEIKNALSEKLNASFR